MTDEVQGSKELCWAKLGDSEWHQQVKLRLWSLRAPARALLCLQGLQLHGPCVSHLLTHPEEPVSRGREGDDGRKRESGRESGVPG